ncbi:MAG TPA: hypothetical protein VK633_00005 [Verrucomicrobiae bacterium]|nr:hypothetical protein [Verrucomicrobiae bacterium]
MKANLLRVGVSGLLFFMAGFLFEAQGDTFPPRVAFVHPASEQPEEKDAEVIFQDDFREAPALTRYFEYDAAKGSFVWSREKGIGPAAGVMKCQFERGQVSAGNLKVIFGKNPFHRGAEKLETFREIYWRVFVQHETGWEGNPAKMARATCIAGNDWSQGFIAHVWGGKGDVLCIDPATGIRDGEKVSRRYNDFQNLRWLGLRQGRTPIFNASESGRWVCVESHIILNTPGNNDGVFELWVDGKLEAARTDLNWHGDWQEYAINAVFLENYWNEGSGKRQSRWFDNFVISRKPIGPLTAANPPVVKRTAGAHPWLVEVSADSEGRDIVWQSRAAPVSEVDLTVDGAHGVFRGSRAGSESLARGLTHWVRIRSPGEAPWSPWHAPFKTPKD